jgi:hypothetical protein
MVGGLFLKSFDEGVVGRAGVLIDCGGVSVKKRATVNGSGEIGNPSFCKVL